MAKYKIYNKHPKGQGSGRMYLAYVVNSRNATLAKRNAESLNRAWAKRTKARSPKVVKVKRS